MDHPNMPKFVLEYDFHPSFYGRVYTIVQNVLSIDQNGIGTFSKRTFASYETIEEAMKQMHIASGDNIIIAHSVKTVRE